MTTPLIGSTDLRICFIGDSFVNGTGDDDCLGWVGRIAAAARCRGHDLTAYNLGIRRDTSADIARRWQHESQARLPDGIDGRLVFSFGVNDCVGENGCIRVPEDESVTNAQTILKTARAERPVLMIGPPAIADMDVNARISRLTLKYAALCDGLGIPFLPLFPILQTSQTWQNEIKAGDGAHPNRGGYQLLADHIQSWSGWSQWLSPL